LRPCTVKWFLVFYLNFNASNYENTQLKKSIKIEDIVKEGPECTNVKISKDI